MRSEQYRLLAEYNQWMNARLYAVCAEIPDAERKTEHGAFFGSIHGTLNHGLLADRIWLGRFQGTPAAVTRLDDILYEDFEDLLDARGHEDAGIRTWVATLDESAWSSTLTYTGIVDPSRRQCPLWVAVTHFFNHQTHHRGQLTTLLAQMHVDYGVTDMIAMPGLVQAVDTT
jgi:uncharacterized damage-inducible protein DinB